MRSSGALPEIHPAFSRNNSFTMESTDPAIHSADVQMHLLLNGSELSISHMGPDYIRLSKPAEHAACRAEIVLIIDGVEERWPVFLPEGLRREHGRVPVSRMR